MKSMLDLSTLLVMHMEDSEAVGGEKKEDISPPPPHVFTNLVDTPLDIKIGQHKNWLLFQLLKPSPRGASPTLRQVICEIRQINETHL